MSEQLYSKAQLKEAWYAQDEQSFNEFISELERPAYVPAKGSVFVNEEVHGYQLLLCDNTMLKLSDFQYCRALTRTECGPVGEALDYAIRFLEGQSYGGALDEIKRIEGSHE